MKIIHINDIASVGSSLMSIQNMNGHESALFSVMPKGIGNNLMKRLKTLGQRLKLVYRARLEIKKTKPDWVHVHYTTSAIWFLDIRCKLAVHAHGSDVRGSYSRFVYKTINQFVFKRADLILFSTPDLEKEMEPYQVSAHYLPNPIDVEYYSPFVDSVKNRTEPLRILWLAMPSKIKGVDVVIPALKFFSEAKNLRFTLLDNICLYESLNEFGVEQSNLKVIQPVDQSQVKQLILEHDIVIGQTVLGALGMSELQAMSCSKVVICFNRFPNGFKHADLLFGCNNIRNLVETISVITSMDTERLEEIGQSCRFWVESTHSINTINHRLNSLYQ